MSSDDMRSRTRGAAVSDRKAEVGEGDMLRRGGGRGMPNQRSGKRE